MAQGPPRQLLLDTMSDPKFANWGVEVHSYEEAVDYAYRSNVFHIRWSSPPRSRIVLDSLSWLAIQRGREAGDTLLAVDEIQFYLPKSWNSIPPSFQDACLTGRHSGVHLLATSQRPSLVHNDFLSQAHRWFIFRTVLKDDLDSVKHIIPDTQRATTLEIGKCLQFP